MVRVRYAPSPTGYMHIGNLRTALYGYLFARSQDGSFILRIEDTDQQRYVPQALSVIYDTLAQTGIIYDEGPDKDGGRGPYIQSQRRELYMKYALQLVEQGHAYYCFCSQEELEARRQEAEAHGQVFKYDKHCASIPLAEAKRRAASGEPFVIRQNTPVSGTVGFKDVVYGDITVDCSTLDDMILIKADGLPTYNFANVIDDHLMEITHVLRGSEYLSSSPKYTLLYNAFGWKEPVYVHLPLIMKDAHNKLSKRNGDASYQDLCAKGFLPQAIINYIALLGWNPGTNQEIFSMPELIEAFSLENISKSPALFDPLKLRWMNGEYIKALPFEEFSALARPWYEKSAVKGKYDYDKLSRLMQSRIECFSEIPEKVDFLPQVAPHSPELYAHKKFKLTPADAMRSLELVLPALKNLEPFNEESIHDCLINLAQDNNLKNGQVLWPVRVALSGLPSTPGGAVELAALLGREETLKRLLSGIALLKEAQ